MFLVKLCFLISFWYIVVYANKSASEYSSHHNLHNDSGCWHRYFGNGAAVCVCTVNHCDNLAHVNLNSVRYGSIAAFVTTKNGDRFRMKTFNAGQTYLKQKFVTIKIDRQKRFQKIIGFGGSFTDSAGFNINKLGPKLSERLIRDYYGQDGIEYNMGRIPIGGSDFSIRPYTYDDNAGDEDIELNHFRLQWEDLQFKIPYMKMAARVNPHLVKYFGSSWSPPVWMKTNNKLTNGGLIIGEPGEKYYKLYAQYLIRFLQEYNCHNISFWGLTMQNEPIKGLNSTFSINSLGMTSAMQRDFLKLDLGPALDQAGYNKLNVMIFDDNLLEIEKYATTILSDQEANKFTTGIAFHWYDNLDYPKRKQLDAVAKKYWPKYFLLSTEASLILDGLLPLGKWDIFDRYASDIIRDLNHWTSGWVDWNLALDEQGGPNWKHNYVDAAIIVNGAGTEYYKQPIFYALGHFSKFLSPDSIRLDHTIQFGKAITNHSSILATTFLRPDNKTVLTVLNMNSISVPILVEDSGSQETTVYHFEFTLKPNSLSSFIWIN